MVFSSLTFLFFFLPVVLLLYFLSSNRWKNLILFLVSLLFYAWGEPIYIFLLLFSTIVDYSIAIYIEKNHENKKAKLALITSMVINICLLGVFKYSDFIVSSINQFFSLAIEQPNLPLPIGISFYTFQTMSYIIDVYRKDARAQRNVIDFGAYISMFPQLVAGPIVCYNTISEQLTNRKHSVDLFAQGLQRFMVGLAKKVLLANNIGMVWSVIQSNSESQMSILLAWLGILAFAFQIYFDFSGYSDMAIGLGLMFGFKFLENFNYPYISRSITEFWRRWHISLGSWFRQYVYIPLGGNRLGLKRQIINIFIVWILTGIWHGASWNFLFWGLYFCFLLIIEKLFLLKWLTKHRVAAHIYTIFAVLLGWVIFAFDDFSQGLTYFTYLFGIADIPFINQEFVFTLITNAPMLVILIIASTPIIPWIKNRGESHTKLMHVGSYIALITLFIVSIAYLVDSTYNPFLYFRF